MDLSAQFGREFYLYNSFFLQVFNLVSSFSTELRGKTTGSGSESVLGQDAIYLNVISISTYCIVFHSLELFCLKEQRDLLLFEYDHIQVIILHCLSIVKSNYALTLILQ